MSTIVAFIGGSSGTGTTTFASKANPLPVTGVITAGTATAPYAATAIAGSQMGLGTVTATALTVPTGATFAYISAEGTDIRWRDDGTSPTASVGQLLYAGGPPQLFSGDLAVVKFIQTAATGTLNVSYYS